MKPRGIFAIVVCLFGALALLTQPCLAGEPKTLKVGGLFCLTGFGSSAETYIAQGAKLSEEWINEKGGLTIKGEKYKVELVMEDMKGTADGAVAAAG